MIRHMSKLAVAVAALALSTAAAEAQRPQLSLGGGASLPTSDLGNAQAAGWHGQVSMGYRPPMFPLGFRVDGAYHNLGGEDVGSLAGRDFRALSVTGNVVLEAPGVAVRPYLIAGAGLYNTKVQGIQSSNNFGVNGGVGLKFHLMDFESFVEARYHTAMDALTDGTNKRSATFVPVTFGISF